MTTSTTVAALITAAQHRQHDEGDQAQDGP
jgi:hypothetical protein